MKNEIVYIFSIKRRLFMKKLKCLMLPILALVSVGTLTDRAISQTPAIKNPEDFVPTHLNLLNPLDDEKLTPMELYFKNMAEYSPTNQKGFCGYVSLIQYLCYYDSFYNDNIIPEKFERNQGFAESLNEARKMSPGVLRKEYSSEELNDESFIKKNINRRKKNKRCIFRRVR